MTLNAALEIRSAFVVATILTLTILAELTLINIGGVVPSLPSVDVASPRNIAPFSDANAGDVILSRPLFIPGRRLRGGESVVLGDELPLRLTGLIVTNDRKLAVFQSVGEKPKTMREGDHIGSWTIQTIDQRQVVLQKPGGTMTIEPAKDFTNAKTATGNVPRGNSFAGQIHGQAPMPPKGPVPPGMGARP
jgi:hypothetical protein